MRVVTEHAHVTAAHVHVATFHQYDKFANQSIAFFNEYLVSQDRATLFSARFFRYVQKRVD